MLNMRVPLGSTKPTTRDCFRFVNYLIKNETLDLDGISLLFIAEEFVVDAEEAEAKVVVENVNIQIAANEPENISNAIQIGSKAVIRRLCAARLQTYQQM